MYHWITSKETVQICKLYFIRYMQDSYDMNDVSQLNRKMLTYAWDSDTGFKLFWLLSVWRHEKIPSSKQRSKHIYIMAAISILCVYILAAFNTILWVSLFTIVSSFSENSVQFNENNKTQERYSNLLHVCANWNNCHADFFGGEGGGSRHEITKIIFRFHESRKTKFHIHDFQKHRSVTKSETI
jgi:hypothetical protein